MHRWSDELCNPRILLFSILLLMTVAGAFGQKAQPNTSWEEKPIDSWDAEDVKTILQNSAWSNILIGKPSHSSPQLGTVVYESRAVFTLRSSLIVRYAMVRSEQLKAKFDSMDTHGKVEFGKKFKPLLDCALCEKFYIVAVWGDSDLLRQAGRVKNRAQNIYLSNEKGEKRELANFSPKNAPDSEALFFFSRFDANGKPLIGPENTTLTFNFKNESGDEPVINLLEHVQIKVRDIVREGQVIF
ncbi:MAG TPA: hypothetical protein VMZ26_14465 [Pyrinomonadaceae bacterium]|nr:hypothetical protein [Pyrinomonadaceae bacterium]